MDKIKILVVEDEKDLRTLIAITLEGRGYEVFQAKDGEEGFLLAGQVKPDAIICDILMPKKDGNQLYKELRTSKFGKHIPFIVLTARVKMKDYFEIVKVDDFIEKPFRADELVVRLEKVLDRYDTWKSPNRTSRGDRPPSEIPEETTVIVQDDMTTKIKPGIEIEVPPAQKPTEAKIVRLKKGKVSGQRVLVLNQYDVYFNRELKKDFESSGHIVEIVTSIAELLETAVRFMPQILMLRMASFSTLSSKLVQIIREMPSLKTTPVLVFTYDERIDTDAILGAGVSAIVKEANSLLLLEKANNIAAK